MRFIYVLACSIAALAMLHPVAARADIAVVAGVNVYPGLSPDAQLGGSINDATLIGSRLKALGFNVVQLGDATASKESIMAALDDVATRIKPTERFVFYFAGHGSKSPDGSGVILPSNASQADQANYITKEELFNKVNAIQAKGRTILLDSCFSGAMTRGPIVHKGLALKARFYNFFSLHAKKISLVSVNNNDVPVTTLKSSNADKICYFVAATESQRAYEDEFNGKSDGIFTHFLAQRLSDKAEQWSAIQADVADGVSVKTEATQSPVLSPSFASVAVFEGKTAASPVAVHRKSQNVWQTFNEDHANPSQVSIAVTPNLSSIAIGEQFHFEVTLSAGEGYLVLLELDPDGNLNLLYPMSHDVADAKVNGGTVLLPADKTQAFSVDKEGQERVKAILFRSKSDAQELLGQIPSSGTIDSVDSAKDRKIVLASSQPIPFYTSTVAFEVIAASKKRALEKGE